jgi:hypothetical protein
MKYYVHLQRGDLVSAMKGLDLGLAMPVEAEVVNLDEQRAKRAVNQ